MLSNKVYRKYGDIWGELFRLPRHCPHARSFRTVDIYGRRPKNNAAYYRFTFYVGKFGFIRRRKTRYGKAFADKQKLKLFYSYIKETYLRQYWAKSIIRDRQSLFYFSQLLESRLDSLALRCNFAFNSRHARTIVETGLISVNGRTVNQPYLHINLYDLVRLNVSGEILHDFIDRMLGMRYKLFPLPDYFIFSYRTLALLMIDVKVNPFFPFSAKLERLRYLYHF